MRCDIDRAGIRELARSPAMFNIMYAWAHRAVTVARGLGPHRTGHWAAGLIAERGRAGPIANARYGTADFKGWIVEYGFGGVRKTAPLRRAARAVGMRIDHVSPPSGGGT